MIVSTVFGKIISIFIIMIIGIICQRAGFISRDTEDKLSKIISYIVGPLLIFTSFQIEYDDALLKNLATEFGLALLSFGLSILLAQLLLRKKGNYDLAVEKFCVIFNNVGYIGMPLGLAVFGSVGVIYVTAFMAAFLLLSWTYGVFLLDRKKFSVKSLINPALIGLVLGIACFILKIRVPESIEYALETVGSMNTPLAMILSGAIIARLDIKKAAATFRKGRIYYVTFLRLIVSSFIFSIFLRLLPVQLDAEVKNIAAMCAACPTGAMSITMSVLFGHDDLYATEIFTLSTIASVVTIPLCLLIAG